MKRICAWCGRSLDDDPDLDEEETNVSHGMCTDCRFHFEAEYGMRLERFLDGLPTPILLVDSEGEVIHVNRSAQSFLDKPLDQINAHISCRVFECEYAFLPGGCGQTVHCSGCAIRNTVMDTYRTGRSGNRVPAPISRRGGNRIEFLISTEKIGDVVALRVDSAVPYPTE